MFVEKVRGVRVVRVIDLAHVLSQSKELIHKNFPGGFAPRPPQCMLDFEVSTETDVLLRKLHIPHISES